MTLAHSYRRLIDDGPSSLAGRAAFLLLRPAAGVYRLLTAMRTLLYRKGLCAVYRASLPVISVGNLTVGGTGKTPVTDAVVKKLIARGLRVAVVSRGYGGRFRGPVGVVATGDGRSQMAAGECGDEPLLLARRNPALAVYVARKRALGVRAAERAGAQVIVLDDGFQHLAVHRDLDIVLLDARAPFGNGCLLPAGALREGPRALRRAGLIMMTHADAAPEQRIPFAGPILSCRHRLAGTLLTLDGREVPWTAVAGESLLAFAGIARPDDFFAALRARGVAPTATLAFADHQEYAGEQLNRLIQSCHNVKLLITTEKDAVKLREATLPCPCLVVPLELVIDLPGELDRTLDRVVGRA